MTHLTEHHILELRDGMLVDADMVAHLAECAQCQSALEQATERGETIRGALETLDRPVDVARAKAAVRARLDGQSHSIRPSPGRTGLFHWSLGRAAALLLVAAGAAAALPGSPVRDWLSGEPTVPAAETAPATVDAPAQLVGGRLTVTEGPLSIELSDVAAGTSIEVAWTDGATVTVRAAPGSGFSYGAGQVRASISAGPVLIDLPRDVSAVTLRVNGRMYLQGNADALEVSEPVADQDDDSMTFRARQ